MNYDSRITAEKADGFTTDVDTLDAARAQRRKRVFIILGIVLVLAAAGLIAYRALTGDAVPAGDREAQLPVVTVVIPGQVTTEGEITATGSLAARREMPVGVVGEGGRVVSVPVDAGDWVRQGQVLASIDRSVQNQQVQSATAQVRVAQADADLAQANLDRALQLVERGFVSRADVDRLTATRDSAAARVRVAQAQLSELRARNARLNIVAPAAGLILERNVEPGQTVSAGSGTLFSIARGGEIELLAQVGETELANIAVGTPAEVRPAGSDKSFGGQVWQLSPVIDRQNRQGTARIALGYDPALRPGGFATAVFRSGAVVAPVLPESAIQAEGRQSYVYIVDAENKVVRRDIETGLITDEGIVIDEGLTGRERIVLRAASFLNPGESVRPKLLNSGGN